jgi:hypothetical protein
MGAEPELHADVAQEVLKQLRDGLQQIERAHPDAVIPDIPVEPVAEPATPASKTEEPAPSVPAAKRIKPAERTIPAQVPGHTTPHFVVEVAETSTGTYIWSRETPAGKVLLNGEVQLSGQTVIVKGLHVQLEKSVASNLSEVQNTLGPRQILEGEADFARYLAAEYRATRVEIYRGTRTTPGFEGRVPRPIIWIIK